MEMNRREFLIRTAATAVIAAAANVATAQAPASAPAIANMPKIKLGDVEVSRLILGSNPFFGYAHVSGNLKKEIAQYYTKERIIATLDEAAANGVTAIWMPADPRMVSLWTEYRQQSGKLPIWIAQPHQGPDRMKQNITDAAKSGAKAIGIQGVQIDSHVRAGKWDVIREWLEHIHTLGLPAGMASHSPLTHLEAEKRKLPTDFYCQCMYVPEDYHPDHRDRALKTIQQIEKPVIAYKVLAAGRVPAKEALEFVLPRIKPKDGVCVGVYTKEHKDQLRENSTMVEVLTGMRKG